MNKNEQLYRAALEAVEKLFSDTSVSREKAIENLKTLKDEINIMLDTLKGEY